MNGSGVLSDRDISEEIHEYRRKQRIDLWDDPSGLDIRPFDSGNIQPASYDLTLGREFEREKGGGGRIRVSQSIESGAAERRHTETGVIEIRPGEFVLGHTAETVELPPNITAEVKGRSSLGRLGLIPHTAGWIDPGFEGQITLEFVNHSKHSVVLKEGQRIAQIVFTYTNRPASKPYGEKADSKYQGQTGVTESRIEKDKR